MDFELMIEKAEKKMDEACNNGESMAIIRYWVGYVDGLRAAQREADRHDV